MLVARLQTVAVVAQRLEIIQDGASSLGYRYDVVCSKLVVGRTGSATPSASVSVSRQALSADRWPINGVRLFLRATDFRYELRSY